MKYLKSIYENKRIVTYKSIDKKKSENKDLESTFFEIILESIKSIFGPDINLIIVEINNLNSIEEWIQFIQEHTTDDDKKVLGAYFLNHYLSLKEMNDQKRRLVEYVKTELYQYITNNT